MYCYLGLRLLSQLLPLCRVAGLPPALFPAPPQAVAPVRLSSEHGCGHQPQPGPELSVGIVPRGFGAPGLGL